MERRRFEQLGRVTGSAIIALGALATEGCGQQGSGHVSPEMNASTFPTAAPISELPRCTYKGPVSSSIDAEVRQPGVRRDVANALDVPTEALSGDSLMQVTCDHPAGGGLYSIMGVAGLAGTYGDAGHCVLIPVSNMVIKTTQQVAECVQSIR